MGIESSAWKIVNRHGYQSDPPSVKIETIREIPKFQTSFEFRTAEKKYASRSSSSPHTLTFCVRSLFVYSPLFPVSTVFTFPQIPQPTHAAPNTPTASITNGTAQKCPVAESTKGIHQKWDIDASHCDVADLYYMFMNKVVPGTCLHHWLHDEVTMILPLNNEGADSTCSQQWTQLLSRINCKCLYLSEQYVAPTM